MTSNDDKCVHGELPGGCGTCEDSRITELEALVKKATTLLDYAANGSQYAGRFRDDANAWLERAEKAVKS